MDSSDSSKYAVNWKNHMTHIKKAFEVLLSTDELTDVTLYAEGKTLRAHKMLLSACSKYFCSLFKDIDHSNPVVVLKGVSYLTLKNIIEFIYNGEVNVESERFNSFLETAEFLQISGLTEGDRTANPKNKIKCSNDFEVNQAEDGRKRKPKTKRKDLETKSENEDEIPKKIRLEDDENEKANLQEDLEPVFEEVFLEDDTIIAADDSATEVILDEKMLKSIKSAVEDQRTPDGKYTCKLCGKKYRQKDSLHKHLGVHAGNTTCFICSKVLSRKTHLERHLVQTHGVDYKSNSVLESLVSGS